MLLVMKELFGHCDKKYVLRSQGAAFKTKNTVSTIKHGGGGIMLWSWYIALSG